MNETLSSFFSYLFMTSIFGSVVSAFVVFVIVLRNFLTSISGLEKQIAYNFGVVFIVCIVLAPIFLYISERLEKASKKQEDI